MLFDEQTNRLQGGEIEQIQMTYMECPECGCKESRLEVISGGGNVICPNCESIFENSEENCTEGEVDGIICGNCGEEIGFFPSYSSSKGEFTIYGCDCGNKLAIEIPEGERLSLGRFLSREWILEQGAFDANQEYEGQEYFVKPVENKRERLAVHLFYLETGSRFIRITEEESWLCFDEEYCVGYMWANDQFGDPTIQHLFVAPSWRRQKAGAALVETWRDRAIGEEDGEYSVNNPNDAMQDLLVSLDHNDCRFVRMVKEAEQKGE